jgi:hypothetical protein
MLGTKAYSWLFGDTFTKNYINQKKVILKRRKKNAKNFSVDYFIRICIMAWPLSRIFYFFFSLGFNASSFTIIV